MKGQTVYTRIRVLQRSSLTWVYTGSFDSFIPLNREIMVIWNLKKNIYHFIEILQGC